MQNEPTDTPSPSSIKELVGQLREMEKQATERPWRVVIYPKDGPCEIEDEGGNHIGRCFLPFPFDTTRTQRDNNAKFIVGVINALPLLLDAVDEVERLRGDVRELDAPAVRFYERDFYVLSNFAAFNLHWRGITFPTSEHAYQHEKFDTAGPGAVHRAVIRSAPSAHEAFKHAELHKAARRPDWDAVKVDIMRDILRAKAEQHEYVRRKLLQTGDRDLIEDSWRDDYWGWGPNRDGKNMLGKLWMEIRAEMLSAASALPAEEGGKRR